ncbi:hypothetical protein [Demequina sp. NBRC 110057]|uniref:hypothetical protein n=1 Tax=Demequina sp. NBRC 110057 TaxID=1570346 RepID=UPI000A053846|nr:hypothetical protein [Demequina sp. NBRC 110057]
MDGNRDDDTARRLAQADALERRRLAEVAHAADLVRQFRDDAVAAGLATARLTARTYDGRSRYKTDVSGWYLRHDRSVAVGTDGQFYVLSVPASLRGRLAGVSVPPAEPPIELGKGGRDGESMPMRQALEQRLAAGDDWS